MNIYVGYDSREPIAYKVLEYSILARTSIPVKIIPLMLKDLTSVYTRQRGPLESTEFSFTRFLVPFLEGFRGRAIFMDCDMLCRVDIATLITEFDRAENKGKAVLVSQHDYTPKTKTKFLGQVQAKYPRKNWSSLILFNNACCQALHPDYVNAATGLELHRFLWLQDNEVGALDLEWNWLVGEYPENEQAKILHYTLGGPWFEDYKNCDNSEEWFDVRNHMLTALVNAE